MREIRESGTDSVFRDSHGTLFTRDFILEAADVGEVSDDEVDRMGFVRDDAVRTDVVPWGTPATTTPLVDLKPIQW